MTRYKMIVNPISGRGMGERVVPEIEKLLAQRPFDYDLTFTEGPLHAMELAMEASNDLYDVVVAVGGDGTANEVLNGIMRAKKNSPTRTPAMGLICVGQGNDFGFGLGIPLDLEAGIAILRSDFRRAIDVGHVRGGDFPEGRYFGNSVGIGFDAVVGFVALRQKRLHGFPSYLLATLKTMFFYYKPPKLNISFEGQDVTKHALMVSIMNGSRLGGGFRMAPNASMEDGYFDLCIADQVSRLRIATLIPHFLRGTQASQDPISTDRANQIVVQAMEGSLPAHADGETLCTEGQRLEIELLPKSLEIVTPGKTASS